MTDYANNVDKLGTYYNYILIITNKSDVFN